MEGEAVCCMLLACRLSSLVQNGRLLPVERTAVLVLVLRWFLGVGLHGPSSGLIPELAALSPPYLPSLGQRGYGVRPGGGRWSSWHRWSSLIPPSGGTMPLVRGEEKPGGVAPGVVLGWAMAVRPIAGGISSPETGGELRARLPVDS